jgi:CTP:molybdopterin cytidylyltransferase MocA
LPGGSGDIVLVLAAGRGTRMGGPKVLMSMDGLPWWRVQRARLDAIGLEQVWLVSPETRTVLEAEADGPTRLVDADSSEPMFETVMRGLGAIEAKPCDGVFVLPIDVPVAKPSVWHALAESKQVAVPVCDRKRGHPLYLPWAWIQTHLFDEHPPPGTRLDTLIRPMRMEIAVVDPTVTINLNTEADVEHWLGLRREDG